MHDYRSSYKPGRFKIVPMQLQEQIAAHVSHVTLNIPFVVGSLQIANQQLGTIGRSSLVVATIIGYTTTSVGEGGSLSTTKIN